MRPAEVAWLTCSIPRVGGGLSVGVICTLPSLLGMLGGPGCPRGQGLIPIIIPIRSMLQGLTVIIPATLVLGICLLSQLALPFPFRLLLSHGLGAALLKPCIYPVIPRGPLAGMTKHWSPFIRNSRVPLLVTLVVRSQQPMLHAMLSTHSRCLKTM